MQNPTTEGLSLSVFKSQYDAYLLTERGLSRSARYCLHTTPRFTGYPAGPSPVFAGHKEMQRS
jgi:hypothetical protein